MQQCDIGRRLADHADPMSGEIVDGLDFSRRLSLRALARKTRRRPQHDKILAHDGDGLGLAWHVEIAASDRKVGLARAKKTKAFDRAIGRNRRQSDTAAVEIKTLRQ